MTNQVMTSNRTARRVALTMDLLTAVREAVAGGMPADRFLADWFRRHRSCGSSDRRWLGNAVFSYFRWKGWLGGEGEKGSPAFDYSLTWLLDAEAIGPELSKLAGEAGLEAATLEPLGPLDLEAKGRAVSAISGRDCPPAALLPEWVPGALHPDFGGEGLVPLVEALQRRAPTWLRLPRPEEVGRVSGDLRQKGYEVRAGLIPGALALDRPRPLAELEQAGGSALAIQDMASQAVGLVCAPVPGESWWDVCAGSGGKTLHLADLMRNKGRILATEARPRTIEALRRRAQRAGALLIHPRCEDVLKAAPGNESFEGILVDAPCTGLGGWGRNPDARWRTPESAVEESAARQQALLERAAGALCPGGALVYAVCTLTRRETVDTVAAFLERQTGFSLDPFPHPFDGTPTDGRCLLAPWTGPCTGMFMARFRKQD